MTAIEIDDLKRFTKQLFLEEVFDSFLVKEVSIVTFNTFQIDGKLRPQYYNDINETEEITEEYSNWGKLRPICFSLIKGKRLPESFTIVMRLSNSGQETFLQNHCPSWNNELVGGLYLNIRYENQQLTCITGVALKNFTLDKSVESAWDSYMQEFIKSLLIVN